MRFLSLILALVLGVPAVSQQSSDAAVIDENAERELYRLLNQERASNNLPPFTYDERLRDTARFHATFVEKHRGIAIQFPAEPKLRMRYALMNILHDAAGENIAIGPLVPAIHKQLLAGGTDRANILDPRFTAVGIGVLRRGEVLFVVQDFARVLTEQPVGQIEQDIVQALNEARRLRKIKPLIENPLPRLRVAACEMAKQDKLSLGLDVADLLSGGSQVDKAAGGHSSRLTSEVIAFTTLGPADLSKTVLTRGSGSGYSTVSIGACFQRSETYPAGIYWVTLLVYDRKTEFRY